MHLVVGFTRNMVAFYATVAVIGWDLLHPPEPVRGWTPTLHDYEPTD